MNTTISLKELTKKYSGDIIRETLNKYTLFSEDFLALADLLTKIENSTDAEGYDKDIVLMVAFVGKGKTPDLISYAGFTKNGKNYKFTAKNCRDIEKLACSNVQLVDTVKFSGLPIDTTYLPQTELELLTVILLSINAFSPKVVDSYFDGEEKNADSITYIWQLIKNKELTNEDN